jgi:hypothetical protein
LFFLPREAVEGGGVEGERRRGKLRKKQRRNSPGFSKSEKLKEARVGYLEIFTKIIVYSNMGNFHTDI